MTTKSYSNEEISYSIERYSDIDRKEISRLAFILVNIALLIFLLYRGNLFTLFNGFNSYQFDFVKDQDQSKH